MQFREMTGIAPTVRENLEKKETVRDKALCGDIAFRVTPATATITVTEAGKGWEQPIVVEVVTAAGQVHDWYNATITSGIAATTTSSVGTVSMKATTLAFVRGRATATLKCDKKTWAADDTATATVAQATIMGVTVSAKTHVTTVVADPSD